jgi:hypothetical protein
MIRQHPLSAAFPAMCEEDFEALVADIKANGQREPITIYEEQVLDGWHRYQACNRLGIKPVQFNLPEGKDPATFVESLNLHRRHLTGSQRAIAVVTVREWRAVGRPGRNSEVASTFRTPASTQQMAKEAQVSEKTIRNAKVAAKGGLGEAVRDGAMTVDEAAAAARGTSKRAKAPAPAKTPKRTLESKPAEDDSADELKEAQRTIASLAQENESLRDRVGVEAMDATEDERTRASNTIRELRAQVKALEAELAAVKVSRDTYMREAGEMKRQIETQRRQLKKLQGEPA